MAVELIGDISLQAVDGRLHDAQILEVDPDYLSGQTSSWSRWAIKSAQPREPFNWPAIAANGDTAVTLALELDDTVQALMQVSDGHRHVCRSRTIDDCLYISFLEVAPWNVMAAGPMRRYKNVGTTCMLLAAAISQQQRSAGRVGLHSIDRAVPFYLRHLFVAKYVDDCENQFYERYMELEPTAAAELLGRAGEVKR